MGGDRRLLAIQTVVVTFMAAMRSLSAQADPELRVLLAEGARERALQLLDSAAATIPHEEGSPLDLAIREARRKIEMAYVRRD